MGVGQSATAPRRRTRPHAARRTRAPAASASAPARRPSRAPSPRARAPRLLQFFLGHASLSSTPYLDGCTPRIAGPSAALCRTRTGRGPPYHGSIFSFTPSSQRPNRPYLKVAPPRVRRHCRATRHGCHRHRALDRAVPRATRPPRHRP
jgi:hypothetical protein